MHTREILLHKTAGRVAIRDTVEGGGIHRLVWRFHLDPALDAAVQGDGVRLRRKEQVVWFLPVTLPPAAEVRIEGGWVSPSYGIKLPTSVVVVDATVPVPTSAVYLFADAPLDAGERARWTVFPGDAA